LFLKKTYFIDKHDVGHEYYTNRNMRAAGAVNAPPSKKNAPGTVFSVALYTALYIGP